MQPYQREHPRDRGDGHQLIVGSRGTETIVRTGIREMSQSERKCFNLHTICNQISNNSQHRNTAVLQFDGTKVVKSILVSIIEKVERIVKSQWGDNTNFTGESLVLLSKGRGSGSLLGRGEGSSAGDDGGKDSSLHVDFCIFLVFSRCGI